MDFDKFLTPIRKRIHLTPLKNLARFEVGKVVFLAFKVEVKCFCDECEYQALTQGSLKQHQGSKHAYLTSVIIKPLSSEI